MSTASQELCVVQVIPTSENSHERSNLQEVQFEPFREHLGGCVEHPDPSQDMSCRFIRDNDRSTSQMQSI